MFYVDLYQQTGLVCYYTCMNLSAKVWFFTNMYCAFLLIFMIFGTSFATSLLLLCTNYVLYKCPLYV